MVVLGSWEDGTQMDMTFLAGGRVQNTYYLFFSQQQQMTKYQQKPCREEGTIILAGSLRAHTVHHGREGMAEGGGGSWLNCLCNQEAERNERRGLAHLCFSLISYPSWLGKATHIRDGFSVLCTIFLQTSPLTHPRCVAKNIHSS